MDVFKRVAPYQSEIEDLREMRFALRLILDAWRKLVVRYELDKRAYVHEALVAVDPGDEGVDDVRLLTAKALVVLLQQSDWGFRPQLLGSETALQDQPCNRIMRHIQQGLHLVLKTLDVELAKDGSLDVEYSDAEDSDREDEDEGTQTQRRRAESGIARRAYVPAKGKLPVTAELKDVEDADSSYNAKVKTDKAAQPRVRSRAGKPGPTPSAGTGLDKRTLHAKRDQIGRSEDPLRIYVSSYVDSRATSQPNETARQVAGKQKAPSTAYPGSAVHHDLSQRAQDVRRAGPRWSRRENLELLKIDEEFPGSADRAKGVELNKRMVQTGNYEGKHVRTENAIKNNRAVLKKRNATILSLEADLGMVRT